MTICPRSSVFPTCTTTAVTTGHHSLRLRPSMTLPKPPAAPIGPARYVTLFLDLGQQHPLESPLLSSLARGRLVCVVLTCRALYPLALHDHRHHVHHRLPLTQGATFSGDSSCIGGGWYATLLCLPFLPSSSLIYPFLSQSVYSYERPDGPTRCQPLPLMPSFPPLCLS